MQTVIAESLIRVVFDHIVREQRVYFHVKNFTITDLARVEDARLWPFISRHP